MEFGKVADPSLVDFRLPPDDKHTKALLAGADSKVEFAAYVGCAKWNKNELKGFYPKGTKEELPYYARQFNAIELNATFYCMPDPKQIQSWKEKTPESFRFFPKITNRITHYRRLVQVSDLLAQFCDSVSYFDEQLGMVFMQLHPQFSPKYFDRLEEVLVHFPKGIPLAVEVRHEGWFSDQQVWNRYCRLLESLSITNIIVDTAGRRDMLHMRLTTDAAFVRFVGANHPSDEQRLDGWVKRIRKWKQQGLNRLFFFVHQNVELESPLLAGHFIARLNKALQLQLPLPQKLS